MKLLLLALCTVALASGQAGFAKSGGAGIKVLGIPLIGAQGAQSAVVAPVSAPESRKEKQFLGGLNPLGTLTGSSSSTAAGFSKSGGAGINVLGIPLIGVGGNAAASAAVANAQSTVVTPVAAPGVLVKRFYRRRRESRKEKQFLGGLNPLGTLTGSSSSTAAGFSKSGGAGINVLGIPLIGVGGNAAASAAVANAQSTVVTPVAAPGVLVKRFYRRRRDVPYRKERQFLGNVLGAVTGQSSGTTASVSKGAGAGINVLGLPLLGVSGDYQETIGVGHTNTAYVARSRR